MIHMGLLNVLIKRLETGIKDLKETHTTDRSKVNDVIRTRDCDDDIDVIFPKRVKIECSSPQCIPVSIDTIFRVQIFIIICIESPFQRDIDSPPASTSSGSMYYSPNNSPSSSLCP